ncbi:uncharacterized protein FSUBG_986 [Fusarium subglutinans]|uniref:BTB domain-containing protein n=1 Tax=Gibberella subglutinans TaxID=42677 RepID=A0A8H5QCG2_GIBSU|nr:uncharacterized protein FSUBG_986 [Fusarium subglutinans]KAF5613256.1 hypothetical protein FSUBG_986 [Fusarium subglutinans]
MENSQEMEERITIIPDGDVVLIQGKSRTAVGITASFLKHISPVFERMLTLPMLEGEAVRSFDGTEPVAIELPAEQPGAMILALRALYGSDPECLTAEPRDIRDVSVLADKYDVVARFRPVAAIWLGCPAATTTQPDHHAAWDLLVAAYRFRKERKGNFFRSANFSFKQAGSAGQHHARSIVLRFHYSSEDFGLMLRAFCSLM